MDKKSAVLVGLGAAMGTSFPYFVRSWRNLATNAPVSTKTAFKLKLYVYDHCPFCVRTRMIFNLKQVEHDLVFLANDDEETPISLVGSKQVPILQTEDRAMPESMDIVKYIDANYGPTLMLAAASGREDLATWIKDSANTFRQLYHPRFHAAVFPEFARLSSREYYRKKKEKSVGPFSECIAKTPELVKQANEHLEKLDALLHSTESVNEMLSYDDIDIFGRLRGLTLIKDLIWPPKLRKYVDTMSEKCDIPLLDSMATL